MTRILAVIGLSSPTTTSWTEAQLARIVDISPAGVPATHRISALDYWEECALGMAGDFAVMTLLAELPDTHPDWLKVLAADPSGMTGLVSALVATDFRVAGADLVLVVGTKATTRAMATSVRLGDKVIHAAYVDQVATPNSVMAHEVGHMLGFEHPWGLVTPADGGVPSAEYGSPYCVMGTAYRSPQVTVPLPAVAGGPPATTAAGAPQPYYQGGGPRLSAAQLVAWTLRAGARLEDRWSVERVTPADGVTVTLADRPWGPGAHPAVVRFPGTDDLLVLELRTGRDWGGPRWDGRLHLDDTDRDVRDSPGVVAHRIQTIPDTVSRKGALPRRAWYLGTIALPRRLDGDLTVAGSTPTTVTVVGGDETAGTVVVRVATHGEYVAPSARVTLVAEPLGAPARSPGGTFDVHDLGPTCSDTGRYGAEAVDQAHRVTAVVTASGVEEAHTVQWRVGGVSVGFQSQGAPAEAFALVLSDVQVQIPNGYRRWAWARRDVPVLATLAWDRLTLEVPGGIGIVPLQVSATVTGPGQDTGPTGYSAVDLEGRRLAFSRWQFDRAYRECQAFRKGLAALWLEAAERYPDLVHGAIVKGDIRLPLAEWGMAEFERLAEHLRLAGTVPAEIGEVLARRGIIIQGGRIRARVGALDPGVMGAKVLGAKATGARALRANSAGRQGRRP